MKKDNIMRHDLKQCGGTEGRPVLGLSPEGKLWQRHNNGIWEELKFNEMYRGYYPPCSFTALECFDQGFIAAGLSEEDGYPCVFQSLLGGVWDQMSLVAASPVSGFWRASGRVNGILCDEATQQVFLLCGNGELVTLPDCPKCVRIKKVADVGILEGYIDGDALQLLLEKGERLRLPLREAVQFRISLDYARQQLAKGGILVDLRGVQGQQQAGEELEGSIALPPMELPDWLGSMAKESFIVFFCSYGINADEAAGYARSQGFVNAFSIGGIKKLFHVD
ncbi:MAG TPA: hypothetical protein GXX75_11285 [Clostridiales bacterium]|nr:hypothetical protein [Clostridiales bacterium]